MIQFDTIDTAYVKAQNARSRGLGAVELTIDAAGRRASRRFMRAFPEIAGIDGWVLRTLVDEDTVTVAYVLRVDTTDITAAYAEVHRKRIETPVIRPRRRRMRFSR